jgi:P-type Ca2+ transporter type 2B
MLLTFFTVVNVFQGVFTNRLFCTIWLVTAVLQVLIVQFGSIAFHVAEGGLSAKYWGISMAIGAGSLVVQQFINVFYRVGQHFKLKRNKRRLEKDRHMASARTGGAGHGHAHSD